MSPGDPTVESAESATIELTVNGPLEASAVRAFAAVVDRAIARRPRRLVIDLTDCPFIDAAAIDVLLDAHRRTWPSGGLLALRNPSPRVRRILEIARLDHVLQLTTTLPSEPGLDRPEQPAAVATRPAPGDHVAP
ncbi:STAS domain-containing protein [Planosporangium thailandense]|uniref:Anti-sigma factor antagonist n=1 Tax=Planosporangium thailandense TaxID=765197 RepID=A0ABX0Y1H5_9ACTN|nr:STAS domain-containing protein [Planosporangium thailandense]NJC71209.1 STAS domain-containing protein [Planosporangium thailandense]